MNIQPSWENGWQFVSWIGGPAAARTWAKKSGEYVAPARERRFASFHAGAMLW
jgi:hypothetical protein